MMSASAEGAAGRPSVPDVTFWAERGGLLFQQARHLSSMKQSALAGLSGTSRTTLSAYEHGRKSPTLETAGRILDAAGFRLTLEPKIEFTEHVADDGRRFHVPTRLPRLAPARALATVTLRGRAYDLAERAQRREAYGVLLGAGGPEEVLAHLDGVLLVELWPDLVLPAVVREAWLPVVAEARGPAARDGVVAG
ncbi:transcriptional regulator with XRE-family HTH domain [Nonomuraea muscovyensis]|uniref:Transcriptional regulator with XRE-family HTH domain n=1 Tax=Nonomuraea muscovyensis TaxID=1124761 RepID=A0A7X0BZJ5_9ACTN|nr:helix-turn-helix transcriptional regulator [Nonomuraea muscovyensis]MBB6345822.1 transcriptional regulator with XRE-family HTH domain [Nonomuraea muscovyensis]